MKHVMRINIVGAMRTMLHCVPCAALLLVVLLSVVSQIFPVFEVSAIAHKTRTKLWGWHIHIIG